MSYYGEQFHDEREEPLRETVYHAGNGFYSPYTEPLWKKERRKIRNAGNGLAAAMLGYIFISALFSDLFFAFTDIIFPMIDLRRVITGSEVLEWSFSVFAYFVSFAVPFTLYVLFTKMPLEVALPFKKSKLDLSVGGVLVGMGSTIIASYAYTVLSTNLEIVGIGISMPEYTSPETVPGMIVYVFSMAVAPAFIEEMAFRGIVMQSLRRFGDVFALVASSLIFGIFHLNLVQMPYAFIAGLCIGYFVMRTGSLWVGVAIHFFNNIVAVVYEFAEKYVAEETYLFANILYNAVIVILAVIALLLILRKYRDMFRFEPAKDALSYGKKTLYFATAPLIVLAMAYALAITVQYIHLL